MRAALLLVCLAAPAAAQEAVVVGFDGPLGEDGLAAGWTFKRWAPVLGLGDFLAEAKVVREGGRPVLRVRSAKSGFIVGTERAPDVAALPRVSWEWKAEALPKGASFRRRETNDQALQLLFGFAGGKVVSYIWDSTGEPGATGDGLAWREDTRVIVLQAGPARLGQWVRESRDLAADFRMLFGSAPGRLRGVALQCNSQHTESAAAGYLGAVTFSPR